MKTSQLDRETLLTLLEDSAKMFVFNLDFVPEEKFSWKPAPDAKSALEIVNHLGEFLDSLARRFDSPTPSEAEPFREATNRDEAKTLVKIITQNLVTAARGASSEFLGEPFSDEMPYSIGWLLTAATMDMIHHGGQIAFLQTLLGDNDMHFDPATIPSWSVN